MSRVQSRGRCPRRCRRSPRGDWPAYRSDWSLPRYEGFLRHRRTRQGRRDFAILTTLVRLGLRAGEVAALELDDIVWRAGEMVVHGKGNRAERMPLPVDVGNAMAAYLR